MNVGHRRCDGCGMPDERWCCRCCRKTMKRERQSSRCKDCAEGGWLSRQLMSICCLMPMATYGYSYGVMSAAFRGPMHAVGN